MGWMDYLEGLMTAIASRTGGQASRLEVRPPDKRVPVVLAAGPGTITVQSGDNRPELYPPSAARRAIHDYAAAVEGHA